MLLLYLALLGLHHLALRALVCRVFTHEAQATVHLREVLCAEDEHQLILNGTLAGKVAHRLYILGLAVFKLLLKRGELAFQHAYIAVDVRYFLLYPVDGLLVLVNLRVKHHQVVKSFLYVGLVCTQKPLLLLYLALHSGTLVTQSLDRII